MDKQYWHNKWKNKQIEFDQVKPNTFLLRYFKALKLAPGAKIFVPLCGKSIDMLWMAQQGYNIIGVEINQDACREFFTQNELPYQEIEKDNFHIFTGDNITLCSGDFFELDKTTLGNVDAIYDRAALIALPEGTRRDYVKHLKSFITPPTQILLITAAYHQNEMKGPPFSVGEQEVNELFVEGFVVSCLHNEIAKEIPKHLQEKGLTSQRHLTFLIVSTK